MADRCIQTFIVNPFSPDHSRLETTNTEEHMCKLSVLREHIPFLSRKTKPHDKPSAEAEQRQDQNQDEGDEGDLGALTEIAAPEPVRKDEGAAGDGRRDLERAPTVEGDQEGSGEELFGALSEVRAPEPVQQEDRARRPSLEDNLSLVSSTRSRRRP